MQSIPNSFKYSILLIIPFILPPKNPLLEGGSPHFFNLILVSSSFLQKESGNI